MATVVVVADDLIWSERLAGQARAAGATVRVVAGSRGLPAALASAPTLVVVDLTARSYDGVAAVAQGAAAGATVIAVAPHDDQDLRARARRAGAQRVYAYARMHADGVAVIAGWLEVPMSAAPSAFADR